jgi:hypothetical protein
MKLMAGGRGDGGQRRVGWTWFIAVAPRGYLIFWDIEGATAIGRWGDNTGSKFGGINERGGKQCVYGMVMGQHVVLGNREIPIENLKELSLDPPHITFPEETGTHRPVNVSESRIARVLGSRD